MGHIAALQIVVLHSKVERQPKPKPVLVGVIQSDLGFMAGSIASLLGGFVVWGSNSSTAKEAAKEIATVEAKRAALIERINPRVVS